MIAKLIETSQYIFDLYTFITCVYVCLLQQGLDGCIKWDLRSMRPRFCDSDLTLKCCAVWQMTLTVHLAATINSRYIKLLIFGLQLLSQQRLQVQIFTPKSNFQEIFISHFSNIGASSFWLEHEKKRIQKLWI